VVARGRRQPVRHRPTPRLLLHVEAQQIVQHRLPVVAAEDVDGVLVVGLAAEFRSAKNSADYTRNNSFRYSAEESANSEAF
jgi:hypothetical protein